METTSPTESVGPFLSPAAEAIAHLDEIAAKCALIRARIEREEGHARARATLPRYDREDSFLAVHMDALMVEAEADPRSDLAKAAINLCEEMSARLNIRVVEPDEDDHADEQHEYRNHDREAQ